MQVPLTNHVAAVLDSVSSPKLFLFGRDQISLFKPLDSCWRVPESGGLW